MTDFIKILPNLLTTLRVLLVILLNLYILNSFGHIPIAILLFLMIFLTDFFDGKAARRFNNTSQFGGIFDVAADLFYMLFSYSVLIFFNLLPQWFLFILIFNFVEFVCTSYILKRYCKEKTVFVFDLVGRTAAVFFYIIPLLAYASFSNNELIYMYTIHILIYIITIMILISFSYRSYRCVKALTS